MPTPRDRHLQAIAEHGRMGWQQRSGYTKRARAEAAIGRWKQVIGDGLRAHTDERRATKVNVAVHALNRMLEFGRPNYVRIGMSPAGVGATASTCPIHVPRWRQALVALGPDTTHTIS